jgi:hypothetical protein
MGGSVKRFNKISLHDFSPLNKIYDPNYVALHKARAAREQLRKTVVVDELQHSKAVIHCR